MCRKQTFLTSESSFNADRRSGVFINMSPHFKKIFKLLIWIIPSTIHWNNMQWAKSPYQACYYYFEALSTSQATSLTAWTKFFLVQANLIILSSSMPFVSSDTVNRQSWLFMCRSIFVSSFFRLKGFQVLLICWAFFALTCNFHVYLHQALDTNLCIGRCNSIFRTWRSLQKWIYYFGQF